MWAVVAAALIFQVQVHVNVPGDPRPDSVTAVQDTLRPLPDSATLATAYLDPDARVMVERARLWRDSVDRAIKSYEAIVREHISAGLRAFRRDRVLYRREAAARIRWHYLSTPVIEALGAREVVPIVAADPHVPDDLDAYLPHLVYDPRDDRMMSLGDGDFIIHPLAEGSERDYRFASGDTTVIRLPDGRSIRILELRLIPRRADPRLLRGALRLDAETHAVVQAYFRLARIFDLERDAALIDDDASEDVEEVPGIFKPIQVEVQYIAIEYGLWEMRWWLPRLIAFEGEVRVGPLLNMPVRFERTYSGYRIDADTTGLPAPKLDLVGAPRKCRGAGCVCRGGRCQRVRVVVPEDTALLLASDLLPHSIFEEGEVLAGRDELEEIRSVLDGLPDAPCTMAGERPRFYWGLDRPGLVRYNRVEGLSVGARVEASLGASDADLTARIGVADLDPGVELGVGRQVLGQQLRLAAYRRLAAVEPDARPFGLGNSLHALIGARDDGDYYRAYGVELTGRRLAGRTLRVDWRLYAEHQSPASAHTDFSLLGLIDDDVRFRDDFAADEADLFGGRLSLRLARGLDPTGFRWRTELTVDGATGSFRYVRPSLGARVDFPFLGPLVASVEGAAGTSFGSLPAQAHWFVGGTATVRGYDPLTLGGTRFARGRAEVATAFPGARLALFTDVGWAGDDASFEPDEAIHSAGFGASFLDGLIRIDLARALREPVGWKLHLYLDAAL